MVLTVGAPTSKADAPKKDSHHNTHKLGPLPGDVYVISFGYELFSDLGLQYTTQKGTA